MKFIIYISLTLFLSCQSNTEKQSKSTPEKKDSVQTKISESSENKSDDKIIDTLLLNINEDELDEQIIVYEGNYDFTSYRLEIYHYTNHIIGSVYSHYSKPWIDSLESEISNNKIIWTNFYSNGSEMGGMVLVGYRINENKIEKIISIPQNYSGAYLAADTNAPFKWGNIKLKSISYPTSNSVKITVKVDLHESPSWETKDSLGKTKYEKTHQLTYVWNEERMEYLVRSNRFKDSIYPISDVYDMTGFLEAEYGLRW